ncbi:MAG: purine/pyrimidine permease [Desulfuromonadaceae bacterium]|nr:purine/pyrimidine permease [Desulfuromonadaceae bacterium]
MQLDYGVDDQPEGLKLWLYGCQWLALTVPTLVILAQVVTALGSASAADGILYLQKMSLVTGLAIVAQIFWGHRLPLVLGPAAVLLVGALASRGSAAGAVETAMICGGGLLFLASWTGLVAPLQRLFTARVIAVVLLLIAFTLLPTILQMLLSVPEDGHVIPNPVRPLCFALGFLCVLFFLQRFLKGFWRATLILWGMIAGSLIWPVIRVAPPTPGGIHFQPESALWLASPFGNLTSSLVLDPGVLVAFVIGYLALAVNDLGSIQCLQGLVQADSMPGRVRRGLAITGLANILSGLMGVLGPVNYSFSPGVISASRCAARSTLLPAAAGLLVLACSPRLIAWCSAVPTVVIATILLYVLCAQVSAGLQALFLAPADFTYHQGLTVGLSLLLGTLIAFLPPTVLNALPAALRPLLGNGFVVGVISCLLLEHLVFRQTDVLP